MKKRFLSLLLVVVLLVTALAGCAQNADGKQGDADVKKDGDVKKVINLALSENITKLDPHDIFNFPVFTACWMMYDTLISTDHEGTICPAWPPNGLIPTTAWSGPSNSATMSSSRTVKTSIPQTWSPLISGLSTTGI